MENNLPPDQDLVQGDNGTFVAYVPAIPGCHAWGQTPKVSQRELANALGI